MFFNFFFYKLCFNTAEFKAKSSFSCHRTLFNIQIISQPVGVGGLINNYCGLPSWGG